MSFIAQVPSCFFNGEMVVLCFSILRVALQSEPSFSEREAVNLLNSSERSLPTTRFSVVHRLL